MSFDWDPDKSRQNRRKHGFGLEEAQSVFDDPALSVELDERDYSEERWIAIGRVGAVVVFVVFINRAGVIRLISARRASPHEEERYYRHWR
ncbi:MAG: BrnT family toxin [Thermomicrobiales bacterium]